MRPEETGHGYATEAVQAALRICFDILGLPAGDSELLRRQRRLLPADGTGRHAS
ncbi:GNAT family protein [Microlunatus ginsengisoli]|uniref:hypothetical protein n=1 Tax=Microlunatus ginsengisoli TaxID=363863 RepID=UPI003CD0ADB4